MIKNSVKPSNKGCKYTHTHTHTHVVSENIDLRVDWIPDQVGDDRAEGVSRFKRGMTSVRDESGRTMTEMLAIIGIIGVLSVGGMTLGGYVIGGIKANRVVSGLQERILLAQKRRIIGQSLSFRERRIEESIMGLYPVEYDRSATDDTIPIYYGKKITVSEIPQQVCEGLKKDASLQATLDEVGGIISFNDGGEDGTCQEENNKFFVLFGGRSEGKCHGRNNGCMACDEYTGDWVVDEAKDGAQIQDSCHICSDGRIVAKDKGRIKPCGSNCCSAFETCSSDLECVTQCPANSSVDYVAGNQIGDSDCYCFEDYRVDAFQTGCRSEKVCNTPCESPLICQDGECVCPNEDDEYLPSFDTGGEMICCPAENIVDGYCCDNPKGDGTCCASDGTACCPPATPLYLKNGTCVVCDDYTIKLEVYQNQKGGPCSRCSNRAYFNAGYSYIGWCIPNKCPADKPLMNYTGICYECSDSTNVTIGDITTKKAKPENCLACDNRVLWNEYYCTLECPDPSQTIVDGVCTCPADKPLEDKNGICHACTDNNILLWPSNNHHKKCITACGNRLFKTASGYEITCINDAEESCDEGYFYTMGKCVSCEVSNQYLKAYEYTENSSYETYNCEEDCPGKRYLNGVYCYKCPSDKSKLTETQCSACLGYWDGTTCQNHQACDSENECMAYNSSTQTCENMCQPVEYLESKGSQWIDTGVIPAFNDNINFQIYHNDYTACWGSDNLVTARSGTTDYFRIFNTQGYSTSTLPLNQWIEGIYNGNTKTFSMYGYSMSSSGVSCTKTMHLFKRQSLNSGGKCRIKFFSIDGKIDLTPVIAPDGRAAMFDQVSKKLFYNKGSGTFKTNLD